VNLHWARKGSGTRMRDVRRRGFFPAREENAYDA
jgi:hypothetical protein